MRRNQSWSGDILSSRAIGLPSFMTVAALAYPTVAAPISYVLIPPVTGGGATVVGGFTFDAIGPTLDAVGLSVTGGPQPGSYTVPVSATAAEIVAEIPSTTDRILLIFDNPLGAVPDPVSAIAFPPSAPDPVPAWETRYRRPLSPPPSPCWVEPSAFSFSSGERTRRERITNCPKRLCVWAYV